jgi:hypothetical protein
LPATAELAPALAVLATELRACGEPWWLIGSAAMAAHGAPVPVRDIDVLLGLTDAAALLTARGLAAAGVPDGRFRSELFASWDAAGGASSPRHARHATSATLKCSCLPSRS